MNSKIYTLIALLNLVKAQDALALMSTVESQVNGLSSQVAGWSSGAGLSGALGIQASYAPLSSSVQALNSALDSFPSPSADELGPLFEDIDSLVSSISGLLDALTEKAGDFDSVGAASIVGGDVTGLGEPTGEIQSKLISKIPSDADCSYYTSASAFISSLDGAFSSAGSAYSVSVPTGPSVPECSGSSSSGAAAGGSSNSTGGAGGSSNSTEGGAGGSNSTGGGAAGGSGSSASGSAASGSASRSASGSAASGSASGSAASGSASGSSSAGNAAAVYSVGGVAGLVGAVAMLL